MAKMILFSNRPGGDFSESPCNGCGARCCQDLNVELDESDLEVMQRGNRVVMTDDSPIVLKIAASMRVLSQGVHVKMEGTIFQGVLVGACGNLNLDGSCGVEGMKPTMCKNEPVDGELCQVSRSTRGPATERL